MSETESTWYLPGTDNQPAGPYPTHQVAQWLQSGEVAGATLAWREGMADWRPLAEIEEFREIALKSTLVVRDAQESGIQDLGKAFDKVLSATKRKARAASLRLSIRRHEKRKDQGLLELGRLFYEHGGDLLSEAPYADQVGKVRDQDETIQQLREQSEALEKPAQASPDPESP